MHKLNNAHSILPIYANSILTIVCITTEEFVIEYVKFIVIVILVLTCHMYMHTLVYRVWLVAPSQVKPMNGSDRNMLPNKPSLCYISDAFSPTQGNNYRLIYSSSITFLFITIQPSMPALIYIHINSSTTYIHTYIHTFTGCLAK